MDVCSTLTSITAIIIIITFAMEFIFEKNNYVRRTSEECMWAGGGWMDQGKRMSNSIRVTDAGGHGTSPARRMDGGSRKSFPGRM